MVDIAIVGGGFTGIAAAKALAGDNVTVFEAAPRLGGVLTDISCQGGEFFSGCQYVSIDAGWEKYLDTKQDFYEFNHTYGSYTDIFGEISISHKVAMPTFDGSADIASCSLAGVSNLKDRLGLYPAQIGRPMAEWFRYIGVDIDKVHHSAALGFQASRIYPRKIEGAVRSIKAEGPEADHLYGLPREMLELPLIKARLPACGYNVFFDRIREELGGKLMLDQTIRLSNCRNKITLTSRRKSYTPDLVIWTVNPVPVFRELLSTSLDSVGHVAEVLVGRLLEPVKAPFYIQVFSRKNRILRIFFYNINGLGCYTIEKSHDSESSDEVIFAAQAIAHEYGEFVLGPPLSRKKNVRFFAYSVDDAHSIKKFEEEACFDNLVAPSFLSYARDERVDSVLASLNEKGIL